MKKYLGLFFVFAVAFFINTQSIRAEEAGDVSGTSETTLGGTLNTGGILPPMQKGASAEARMKAQADIKLKRQEMAGERKEKREEIKTNIEDMRKKNETIRAEAKMKMDALKANIKAEKDKKKATTQELRITGRENALKRFNMAIEKMLALTEKVNTQITRLKAKGVDVTSAASFEATAETKLTEAQAKIKEANTLFATSTDELSATDKATLKTLVTDTENLLKETHEALNQAIKSLRDALKVKMEASVQTEATTSVTIEGSTQ